jgi:hypothetical protein
MPTFVVGAGFNVDAVDEAEPVLGESLCGYPVIGETVRVCFKLARIPAGKSVEDLFSDALERGDYGPLVKLADRLRPTTTLRAGSPPTSD